MKDAGTAWTGVAWFCSGLRCRVQVVWRFWILIFVQVLFEFYCAVCLILIHHLLRLSISFAPMVQSKQGESSRWRCKGLLTVYSSSQLHKAKSEEEQRSFIEWTRRISHSTTSSWGVDYEYGRNRVCWLYCYWADLTVYSDVVQRLHSVGEDLKARERWTRAYQENVSQDCDKLVSLVQKAQNKMYEHQRSSNPG